MIFLEKIQRTNSFEIVSDLAKNGDLLITIDTQLIYPQIKLIYLDVFDIKVNSDDILKESIEKHIRVQNNSILLGIGDEYFGWKLYYPNISKPRVHYKSIYNRLPTYTLSKLNEFK